MEDRASKKQPSLQSAELAELAVLVGVLVGASIGVAIFRFLSPAFTRPGRLVTACGLACIMQQSCSMPPSSDLPSEDSWPPPVRKVYTMAGANLGQSGCLVTHEKKRASASKRASPKAARCRKVWPPPQLLGRIRVDRKAVAHELLAAAGKAPRPRARLPRTPVTQQVPAQSFPKSVTTELHKSHLYVDTTFARVMSEACPDLGLNQT